MQRTFTTLVSGLGILLAAGCEPAEPTGLDNQALALADTTADTTASLGGNIVDSDSLPVARSRVFLYLVGPLPPDTLPPDTLPPPDSLGSSRLGGTPMISVLLGDTIPDDSVPPPPPNTRCGDRGQLVGRTRSDQNGLFQFAGLAAGVYDVRALAPGEKGTVCGALVRNGQPVFVTVLVNSRTGIAASIRTSGLR